MRVALHREGLEDHTLTLSADRDLVRVETELLGKPNRLAATAPKDLRGLRAGQPTWPPHPRASDPGTLRRGFRHAIHQEYTPPMSYASPETAVLPSAERASTLARSRLCQSYAWAGNSEVGEGRMTITEATPPKKLVIKLKFLKPMTRPHPRGAGRSGLPGANSFQNELKGPDPSAALPCGVTLLAPLRRRHGSVRGTPSPRSRCAACTPGAVRCPPSAPPPRCCECPLAKGCAYTRGAGAPSEGSAHPPGASIAVMRAGLRML